MFKISIKCQDYCLGYFDVNLRILQLPVALTNFEHQVRMLFILSEEWKQFCARLIHYNQNYVHKKAANKQLTKVVDAFVTVQLSCISLRVNCLLYINVIS